MAGHLHFRALLLLSLVGLIAVGCARRGGGSGGGGGGGGGDADEDGLSSSFEGEIGTDPDSPDTDGDGYMDGEEYLAFFDPLDSSDYPYMGDYVRYPQPSEDVWEELSWEAGWSQGEFSRDWTGDDQNGQPLSLRRFYGQVILVDVSAEWCVPCREAASRLEDEWLDRRDDGFVAFTVLTEDGGGSPAPSATRWAGEFGLTSPVIEDGQGSIWQRYLTSAYPSYTIIARDHTIVNLDAQGGEADWGLIDDLLDEDVPEVDYPMP